MNNLLNKFKKPGPKRILALDGGGIRGVLTIGMLERLETVLRKQHNNPDLLLCDYFDLIGGTSTGSILATGLALGMTATELRDHYFSLGGVIFGKKKNIFNYIANGEKFDYRPLTTALKNVFGDVRLGDQEKLKTGLCIVTKRLDTSSTWPFINHPESKYYNDNADLPLWQLVRASAAAPTYFLPVDLNIGNNEFGTFIDGGVSMSNNPSFLLLMVATLRGYPFHWKAGADNLLMVSLGTGFQDPKANADDLKQKSLLGWASAIPNYLLLDANYYNQLIMQILSNSPTAKEIDSEVGNLQYDTVHGKHMLSYLRYDLVFENDYLHSLGFHFSKEIVDALKSMDSPKYIKELYEIGLRAGNIQIKPIHFPSNFKLNNNSHSENQKLRFDAGKKPKVNFENYTKNPIPVGAVQIDEAFEVETMEGIMQGKPGDYLMKGPKNELYVCDEKIFLETYTKMK
ncbi:MAG TPA: patatin-like phospholipase family protein [Saprospiraceae bacterium]|jgi:patatin-like phospholipase/acyl hydrolase|nr:patatin-like phospholipase family protein [Saprospiraceae bacterium]HRO08616.1 patatin-like phospholipase family protein [Saprospiraceae bacterium]HRP42195.1 patatin-like phospholipase family protein [Saprospiraceae bacterium]